MPWCRVWVDAGKPERTPTGNELRPKQVEAFLWTEALLADTNEVEGQVLLQLEKGDHEITLTSLREEAVLDYRGYHNITLDTGIDYKAEIEREKQAEAERLAAAEGEKTEGDGE